MGHVTEGSGVKPTPRALYPLQSLVKDEGQLNYFEGLSFGPLLGRIL